MKNLFLNIINKIVGLIGLAVIIIVSSCMQPVKENTSITSLKDAFEGKFHIGTALNSDQIFGKDSLGVKVINTHFNSVVAENCMKSMYLQPNQGQFYFEEADEFIEFGEKTNKNIIGHTLIWHSQAPAWLFIDDSGNDVSRDTLISRMKNHIYTVVGRYKGRVDGWDVVNEAFEDNGDYRQSKFYTIIGPEFIDLAFKFAHEADPEAQLYYNDYSMSKEGKRNSVVRLAKQLKADGIRIDGIGMQGHYPLNFPTVEEFSQAIDSFASTGVKVMITELDISILPSPFDDNSADVSKRFELTPESNPYANGLPDSMQTVLTNRYIELFKVLLDKHEDINRVTVWGVNDQQSWRNYWPIDGRSDYPLLFDRNNQPKPVVDELIKMALETK